MPYVSPEAAEILRKLLVKPYKQVFSYKLKSNFSKKFIYMICYIISDMVGNINAGHFESGHTPGRRYTANQKIVQSSSRPGFSNRIEIHLPVPAVQKQ